MLLAPAGSFLCMKLFKTGPCGDNGGTFFYLTAVPMDAYKMLTLFRKTARLGK